MLVLSFCHGCSCLRVVNDIGQCMFLNVASFKKMIYFFDALASDLRFCKDLICMFYCIVSAARSLWITIYLFLIPLQVFASSTLLTEMFLTLIVGPIPFSLQIAA